MFQREPGFDPCKDLWQECLRLAVDDALIGPTPTDNRQTFLLECGQARTFLTTMTDDLVTVCHLAGMNPRAVLERMRDRIANAPTPEELHDQPRQRRSTAAKRQAKVKVKTTPFPDQTYIIGGTARTAREWCERSGVSLETARARVNAAWAPERAFLLTKEDVLHERQERTATSIAAQMHRTGQTKRSRAASGAAPRYLHDGLNLTLAEWSIRTGIKKPTLYKRVALAGWTIAEALTTRDARHHRFVKVTQPQPEPIAAAA